MLRSSLGSVAAAALVAILTTVSARGADDPGGSMPPAAEEIQNAAPPAPGPAPDTAPPPVEPSARPAVRAAREDDQGPGPAIEKAAQESGHALDRGTKDFRDGAEKFFKDVGRFFSGDK